MHGQAISHNCHFVHVLALCCVCRGWTTAISPCENENKRGGKIGMDATGLPKKNLCIWQAIPGILNRMHCWTTAVACGQLLARGCVRCPQTMVHIQQAIPIMVNWVQCRMTAVPFAQLLAWGCAWYLQRVLCIQQATSSMLNWIHCCSVHIQRYNCLLEKLFVVCRQCFAFNPHMPWSSGCTAD